jgi:polysaccharide biosynthesis protein PslG
MKRHTPTLFTLVMALALVACVPQAPIIVYVTPTPPPTEAASLPAETSTYTHTPEATTIATTTALPSGVPTAAPATRTPVGAIATQTVTPNVVGPIIQPGYTLPPSNTPLPSPTPTATNTLEPGAPTHTPAPSNTPPPATGGVIAPLPNLDGARVGMQLDINLDTDDWNDAMARIEGLNVRWIKVQLPWRDMQPNGPDERDNEFFRRIEQHLEDAARRGFSVLVSVAKAPAWARSNQTEDGPPDDPNALAAFITLIFQEFNAGTNRPVVGEYIDAIEIWNEPNLLREWQGALPFNGAGYMQLFAPAYQAVRAYSQEVIIVSAGPAPTGNSEGSVEDTEFLRQMYAAGLGQYGDIVIGIHPYGWGNPPDARCCGSRGWDDNPHFFFLETIDAYRATMNANGHEGVQLWATEFGYASWDGFPLDPPEPWMGFTDKWAQGGYTVRALQIVQERGDMGVTMLWNLNFATLAGGTLISGRDERAAYSMVVPGQGCQVNLESGSRTERPVYWMLYDALRPEVDLDDYCGTPPNPIPGLG